MAVDDRDNLQIILEELHKYGGLQKDASGSRMVCCPFHGERAPSCGITLDVNGNIPLGFYHCFGCQSKGRWNSFAAKTGLQPIKEWNSGARDAVQLVTRELEDDLLGSDTTTLRGVFNRMGHPEAQPWPIDKSWRGFTGELINRVGGHIVADRYEDSIAVLFPVTINGQVRGAVKAVYERREHHKTAYVTMKGPWIMRRGLFPHDYTKELMNKHGYDWLILVEGPRDALALLRLGIPTLAILGSNNIGQTKTQIINNLGVTRVYVMSDGDSGGDAMWANVKKHLKQQQLPVQRFKLPVDTRLGKNIDPGNAPRPILNRLVEYLSDTHGFTANEELH